MKFQESPSLINMAFRSVPIVWFQESSDICHHIECWGRSLWPSRWFCCQCLPSFYHDVSCRFLC